MRKKLLLADDSITIQKVVELTFPSDEFEVVTAGNGRLAVDKAMAFLPDIVLCDVIMPQLDGYQVCEALRASEPLKDVPILLLNGAFEPYDAERAKTVGALGNVSKPFDPPALVARVKEILAERSTQPMSLDVLAALGKAQDDARAGAATVPAPPEPHAYTYDESETHPVSTIEVPMDIRELAARSLSLDAPVFSAAEPDVLTPEDEPSDFAETLHGPLDGDIPPATAEVASSAEPLAVQRIEEIDAVEEMQPIAATGEFEAPPVPLAAPPAPEVVASEPVEFEADTAPAVDRAEAREEPPPRPAAVVSAAPPLIEEFSGEHEFEPHELGASIAPAPEPEPMAVRAPERAVEAAIGLPAPAPRPVAPPEVSRPAPVEAVPDAGSFGGLMSVPEAVPATAPSSLPSADVPVPMDMVQQIAQRVISQVSERIIREIAWDVIPGLAEKLIRAEIEKIKARAESERD